MIIEGVILAHLLASGPVAAVVSTRGYQLKLPQNPVLPALRVQLIGEVESYTLTALTNFFVARIQVDLWTAESIGSDPYTAVRAGGRAIRNALVIASCGGQSFSVGSPSDVQVTSVRTLDRTVTYEADELRMIRLQQDFSVVYREL